MEFVEVDLFIEWPPVKDDRMELDLCLYGLYDVEYEYEYRYELRNGWVFKSEPDLPNDYILDRAMSLADGCNANYYRNVVVSYQLLTDV